MLSHVSSTYETIMATDNEEFESISCIRTDYTHISNIIITENQNEKGKGIYIRMYKNLSGSYLQSFAN